MKARYVDLPAESLLNCLAPKGSGMGSPWSLLRGRPVAIDPHPFPGFVMDDRCGGPWFTTLNNTREVVCIHLIELDESALDAEIEECRAFMPTEVLK